MDPDATLGRLRKLAEHIEDDLDESDDSVSPGDLHELIELIDSLDGWLSGGGFLPKAWNRARLLRTEARMATPEETAEIEKRYGQTAEELTAEAERGYDVSQIRPRERS